jgi:hypothetical protein
MSDEALRRLAAEILSRSEFAGARRTFVLLDRLREWLRNLAGWIEPGGLRDDNPVLYYALLAALFALAAALIAHVTWSVRAALRFSAPPSRRSPQPARDFAAAADRLARQGRYLEAARQLQLGVLERLLRGRVLELARSEPNEVLRRRLLEARLAENDRRDLLALLDRFERSWFRDRRDDPALFEAWRRLHQRLAPGEARP